MPTIETRGTYLATHESQNLGGQLQKFADFDKQVVHLGVFDPAESKSGLTFLDRLTPPLSFRLFQSQTRGADFQSNTALIEAKIDIV